MTGYFNIMSGPMTRCACCGEGFYPTHAGQVYKNVYHRRAARNRRRRERQKGRARV